ncbi:MAG: type II toxin-antitoxin system RelE/ParE family toxin [Ferruginibacter sp.]
MKTLKVIFKEQAIFDLEDIWLYTLHTWSLTQADRYHSMIVKEIDFLAAHPSSGKNQHHIRAGYRSSKIKSHVIFYRILDNELEIIRILHERMDIPNRLKD